MPTPTKTAPASRKKRAAILGTGAGIAVIGGGLATVWPTGSKSLPDTLPTLDTCRVIEVVDGDTLHASCDALKTITIRLFGADAPEMNQPSGPMARAALGTLLVGQVLTIQPIDRDRYGRLVAQIGTSTYPSVEKRQIETGLAWWSPQYAPDSRDLLGRGHRQSRQARPLGHASAHSPLAMAQKPLPQTSTQREGDPHHEATHYESPQEGNKYARETRYGQGHSSKAQTSSTAQA